MRERGGENDLVFSSKLCVTGRVAVAEWGGKRPWAMPWVVAWAMAKEEEVYPE